MKKKYSITLEDNDVIFRTMTAKEKILEMIPKNKTTTATLVTKVLKLHSRRSLGYLRELEKGGYFSSEMGNININGKISRVVIFKRIK